MNVWAKYQSSGLILNGEKLMVHLLEPLDRDASSHAVHVTGIPKAISHEMLNLYFENTKASSGGDIECTWYDSEASEAVIVFKNQEGLFSPCDGISPASLELLQLCIDTFYFSCCKRGFQE